MKYEVTLKVVREAEEYNLMSGLIPELTYSNSENSSHGESFDAFWSGDGIFHDIFEHWFEGILAPFKGESFMSLYGEMVASAIKLWYMERIGFNPFMYRTTGFSNHYNGYEDTVYQLREHIEHLGGKKDADHHYVVPLKYNASRYTRRNTIYLINDAINQLHYYIEKEQDEYKVPSKLIRPIKTQVTTAYCYGQRLAEKMWETSWDNYQRDVRDRVYDVLKKALDTFMQLTKHPLESYAIFNDDPDDYEPYKEWKYLQASIDTRAKNPLKLKVITLNNQEYPFSTLEARV